MTLLYRFNDNAVSRTIRRTAANRTAMAAGDLPPVGKTLGHRRHHMTAEYAYLENAHLVEAAESAGSIVTKAIGCDWRE